ncbi:hypothetical protein D3C73_945050 [compost metagenome]
MLHEPQQVLLQLFGKTGLRRNRQSTKARYLRQALVQHLIAEQHIHRPILQLQGSGNQRYAAVTVFPPPLQQELHQRRIHIKEQTCR